jgi:hypothetical protein
MVKIIACINDHRQRFGGQNIPQSYRQLRTPDTAG